VSSSTDAALNPITALAERLKRAAALARRFGEAQPGEARTAVGKELIGLIDQWQSDRADLVRRIMTTGGRANLGVGLLAGAVAEATRILKDMRGWLPGDVGFPMLVRLAGEAEGTLARLETLACCVPDPVPEQAERLTARIDTDDGIEWSRLLTVADLKRIFTRSRNTIGRWLKGQKIRNRKIGGSWLIALADLPDSEKESCRASRPK
jgi:hypothetical protein